MDNVVSRDRDRELRLLKAKMAHPKFGLIDILIRNVSDEGIGGKCRHDLEPGEGVSILLADGAPAPGVIVWRMGDGFGLRLSQSRAAKQLIRHYEVASSGPRYEVPLMFRPQIRCRRPGLRPLI